MHSLANLPSTFYRRFLVVVMESDVLGVTRISPSSHLQHTCIMIGERSASDVGWRQRGTLWIPHSKQQLHMQHINIDPTPPTEGSLLAHAITLTACALP